ncbi:hypothetical protein [Salinarchaeum laminariae]|uniref:hypothetical protein n=1 Tax=Salinarchaeum laminariae TaxID=869888 RepID=UPI0020BE64EF|nr:hypothetical protein [Salinarchaeum laminariae]
MTTNTICEDNTRGEPDVLNDSFEETDRETILDLEECAIYSVERACTACGSTMIGLDNTGSLPRTADDLASESTNSTVAFMMNRGKSGIGR